MIRTEQPIDADAIHAVTAAAFRGADYAAADVDGDPGEAALVGWLRADSSWIPELSLVAELDGVVVGHLVATRGYVGESPALGLGPVSVHPDQQRRGFGSALVNELLARADKMGETLVALLGDPDYYERFGFRESTWFGVQPPVDDYGKHFQALTLAAHDPAMVGRFRYAAPFDRL
ncbi:MAG TPA: N-acetyltransferase [Nocardioidaceae bacterium]|nr:N-acetyltransferase [Nocardioidaceae bacterium]